MDAKAVAGSAGKPPGLPAHATLSDISATYNQDTIPRQFQTAHTLPPEVWAVVVVMEGEVSLKRDGKTVPVLADGPAVVPPNMPFALVSTGKAVRFCLHYYHGPVLQDGKALAGLMSRRVA